LGRLFFGCLHLNGTRSAQRRLACDSKPKGLIICRSVRLTCRHSKDDRHLKARLIYFGDVRVGAIGPRAMESDLIRESQESGRAGKVYGQLGTRPRLITQLDVPSAKLTPREPTNARLARPHRIFLKSVFTNFLNRNLLPRPLFAAEAGPRRA
jgi:hypothetical protein